MYTTRAQIMAIIVANKMMRPFNFVHHNNVHMLGYFIFSTNFKLLVNNVNKVSSVTEHRVQKLAV